MVKKFNVSSENGRSDFVEYFPPDRDRGQRLHLQHGLLTSAGSGTGRINIEIPTLDTTSNEDYLITAFGQVHGATASDHALVDCVWWGYSQTNGAITRDDQIERGSGVSAVGRYRRASNDHLVVWFETDRGHWTYTIDTYLGVVGNAIDQNVIITRSDIGVDLS